MTQPNQQQTPLQVAQLHRNADTDSQPSAAHHTLGSTATQASPGSHQHKGTDQSRRLYDPPGSVTGSRGGNAALQSLLSVLASQGIIVNNTSA